MIELIIVVAILGILAGIAILVIPRGRMAVNQAANGFAHQFPRARIEALRSDTFAGVAFSTVGDGSYYVCVDQDANQQCAPSETVQTVVMGQGSYASVRLTATSTGFTQFMFDPRGIPMSSGGTVTFSTPNGDYTVSVAVTAAGKASVQ